MGLKSGGIINRHCGSGDSFSQYLKGLSMFCNYDASTLPGADGDAVASWPDASGNGYTATAAGAARPLLKLGANGINSRAAVSFNGTAHVMTNSSVAEQAQPNTFIFVAKQASAAPGGNIVLFDATDGTKREFMFSATTTGNLNVNAGSTIDSTIAMGDTANIISVGFNGASSFVRKNGTGGAIASPGATAIKGLTLGALQGGSSNFWGGLMGQFIGFHRALLTVELQYVERYLGAKWGITVA